MPQLPILCFFHFIRLFSIHLLMMFALRRLEEEEERHIRFSITQPEHWHIKRFLFFLSRRHTSVR